MSHLYRSYISLQQLPNHDKAHCMIQILRKVDPHANFITVTLRTIINSESRSLVKPTHFIFGSNSNHVLKLYLLQLGIKTSFLSGEADLKAHVSSKFPTRQSGKSENLTSAKRKPNKNQILGIFFNASREALSRSLRSSLACSDAKQGEIFHYPHNLGDYHQEVSSSKSKLKTHEPRSEVSQFKGNNLYICELSDTLPTENVHRGSMWRSERDPVQQGVCYLWQLQECDSLQPSLCVHYKVYTSSFKHRQAWYESSIGLCNARNQSVRTVFVRVKDVNKQSNALLYLHITDNILGLSAQTNDPN